MISRDTRRNERNAVLRWLTGALVAYLFSTPLFAGAGVTNLSVYSTLPNAKGQRRVAVSFRVVNGGSGTQASSVAGVTLDNQRADLAIPALAAGGTAYVSHAVQTTSSQFDVLVEVGTERVHSSSRVGIEAGRWRSIGPSKVEKPNVTVGVGRVTTIAIDPRTSNTFYVGARGSGIWKTTDGGNTWLPIGDALPATEIDAIAVDGNNSNRVLIATPAGFYESKNGGEVWTSLTGENLRGIGSDGGALLVGASPNVMKATSIDDAAVRVASRTDLQARVDVGGGLINMAPPLYLSTAKGLRVSTDGGRNWPTVIAPTAPVLSLQFSTSAAGHLFASTALPPAVYEAKDGGLAATSWRQLVGCPSAPLPTIPPSSNVWIAESAGTKWVSFRSGKADGNVREIWRSTAETCDVNGWTEHAWEKISTTGACNDYENNWSYLFAHPADPLVVFKGGRSLCRSASRGDGLMRLSVLHDDQHAIAVSRSNPAVILFGNDGGIYRSNDKGVTAAFIGEGLSNTELLKIDTDGAPPRIVVGGSQDNGSSTWDGTSPIWNYIGGGDSALVAFDRVNPSWIYEIGQSMRQLGIHKGDVIQTLGDASLPDCLAYSESGSVFHSMVSTGGSPPVAVTCQGIWKGGPSWNRWQSPPAGGDFHRFRLSTGHTAAGATDLGHVYFGNADKPLADVFHTPSSSTPSAISFASPMVFYVSMNTQSSGSLYRFQCTAPPTKVAFAGTNLDGIALGGCNGEGAWLNVGKITAMSVDPLGTGETVLAALQNQGIFRGVRDIAGKWTWSPYNDGLPAAPNVTELQPRIDGSVVAATYGRGAFLLYSKTPKLIFKELKPPSGPLLRNQP